MCARATLGAVLCLLCLAGGCGGSDLAIDRGDSPGGSHDGSLGPRADRPQSLTSVGAIASQAQGTQPASGDPAAAPLRQSAAAFSRALAETAETAPPVLLDALELEDDALAEDFSDLLER